MSNILSLSDNEKKVIYYMLENPGWHSGPRIGETIGKQSPRNRSNWARRAMKRLVKHGYITYVKSANTYRLNSALIMPILNGRRKKNDTDPIDYFITKHKGNNNTFIATR